MKKIFYFLLIYLAFVLGGCAFHRESIGEEFAKNQEASLAKEVASLYVAVQSFLLENDRWPGSNAELQSFVCSKPDFDHLKINWDALIIEELEDESIRLEYIVPDLSLKATMQNSKAEPK